MGCMHQSDAAIAAFFDKCAINGDMAEFPPKEEMKLQCFLRMWNIQPGQRVLEPGCGSGRLTVHLAEAVGAGGHVLAIDLSPGMIRRARAHGLPPQAKFAVQSLNSLTEPAGTFDQVICLNVFPHFSNHPHALAQIARVLKPGGHLWVNHFEGRESLNHFHHEVGDEVEHHMLPDENAMRRLTHEAGLITLELIDRAEMYALHAVKRRT